MGGPFYFYIRLRSTVLLLVERMKMTALLHPTLRSYTDAFWGSAEHPKETDGRPSCVLRAARAAKAPTDFTSLATALRAPTLSADFSALRMHSIVPQPPAFRSLSNRVNVMRPACAIENKVKCLH